MGRLTTEERRRVFLAQEQARRAKLARLTAEAVMSCESSNPGRSLRLLLTTAVLATLLSGGWIALHAVEFHLPTSIVEALLPRR
jgi:hypothetical protein